METYISRESCLLVDHELGTLKETLISTAVVALLLTVVFCISLYFYGC